MFSFLKSLVHFILLPITLLVLINTSSSPRILLLPGIYLAGLFTPRVFKTLARLFARNVSLLGRMARNSGNAAEDDANDHQAGLYGLDHAVLNSKLTMPPETMWMNMGYWKVSCDFFYFYFSIYRRREEHLAMLSLPIFGNSSC